MDPEGSVVLITVYSVSAEQKAITNRNFAILDGASCLSCDSVRDIWLVVVCLIVDRYSLVVLLTYNTFNWHMMTSK